MNRKIFAVAEWLLERFGVPQRNESLMGDLMEEYSAGRSGFWLLRQIVNAIATTVARDIKHHWLLTARAIAMGLALWLGFARIVSHPLFWPVLSTQIGAIVIFTLWPAFIGWLVARTHRAQQAAMVLAYAASQAIYSICDIAIQWPAIRRLPPEYFSPPWLEVQIGVGCVVVLFTLIGGFLQKPRGLSRTA